MNLEIIENKCPYCEETFFMNKRSFANHMRWCKKNPKYEDIRNSTIKKLSGEKVSRKLHVLKCETCGKEYTVSCTDKEFDRGYYKKTCSDLCVKKLTAKKAGKEKNKKISLALRKNNAAINDDYDENIGAYVKKCELCGKEFITKKHNQRFCSYVCSAKHRNLYKKKSKTKLELYKRQCQFAFALKDFPEEFNFSLINENGWYKAKNHGDNLNGVSRDHMYSINEGFKNGVDPYYISHPANCELLLHPDNAAKNVNCSISKDELMKRIREWENRNGVYESKIDYFGIENFKEEK